MRILVVARNRAVGVEDGLIVPAEGPFDQVFDLPGGEVRPGLINAHDHLHRNHYGRLGAPPYRNARDWALDIQDRHRERIDEGRRLPRADALRAGAWKNLRAGVTTVVHHDRWEPAFDDDFPVRVARIDSADSLAMADPLPAPRPGCPFAIHLAEGVDPESAAELDRVESLGLLGPHLIAVHGVALTGPAIARFEESGAALVWCPSSNHFLFGRTCAAELLEAGIDLLLGSDSLLTGRGDLLDELSFARSLGLVDDARLEDSVGRVAARRLGRPEPSLEIGCPADLVVLTRPLLEASAADVALVMVGGRVRVAREAPAPAPLNLARAAGH